MVDCGVIRVLGCARIRYTLALLRARIPSTHRIEIKVGTKDWERSKYLGVKAARFGGDIFQIVAVFAAGQGGDQRLELRQR